MGSDLKNLSQIRSFIQESAVRIGLSEQGMSEIRLAVDEACANVINHGYKDGNGDLTVSVDGDDNRMTVTISDNAPAYNPLTETPEPDLGAPLDIRPLGGMGVLIVRQNTDAVEYRAGENGGNILILSKNIPGPSA